MFMLWKGRSGSCCRSPRNEVSDQNVLEHITISVLRNNLSTFIARSRKQFYVIMKLLISNLKINKEESTFL